MGSLQLLTNSSNGNERLQWSITGEQGVRGESPHGAEWQHADITVSTNSWTQVLKLKRYQVLIS